MSQQDDINRIVSPIAKQYGVPDLVWKSIIQVESGYNPRAVGDHGTSFGLFQLHRGGQLGNLTPEQAYDPKTNAQTAMPAIAKAWNALKSASGVPGSAPRTEGTYNWWYKFAILSGHPGNDPNAADSEAQKLAFAAQDLQSGPNAGQNGPGNPPADAKQSDDCNGWNPLTYGSCINSYVQTTYIAPLQAGAAKVGIFVLALALALVGFWALVRAEGA